METHVKNSASGYNPLVVMPAAQSLQTSCCTEAVLSFLPFFPLPFPFEQGKGSRRDLQTK